MSLLFHFLHVSVIVFNLTGWILERTKRMHLILVSLTLASWIGLGLKYGLGYCFLTDWHWRILEANGAVNLPNSYVKYIIDLVTGFNSDPFAVDVITGISFVCVALIAFYRNRDLIRKWG
ncbi:MAG: DUF2784 domain-containing protein [Spirochaetia bacterium]|nr:DUF2784 domain-containing protein [Spirochaetia bacterium]